MKLTEAIKYKNKSRLLDKIEARIVNDFEKIYKPGKKVAIDVYGTVFDVANKNSELIAGDIEEISHLQIKKLLKAVIIKVSTFPFNDEDMKKVFTDALIKDIRKLKGMGRV